MSDDQKSKTAIARKYNLQRPNALNGAFPMWLLNVLGLSAIPLISRFIISESFPGIEPFSISEAALICVLLNVMAINDYASLKHNLSNHDKKLWISFSIIATIVALLLHVIPLVPTAILDQNHLKFLFLTAIVTIFNSYNAHQSRIAEDFDLDFMRQEKIDYIPGKESK